jgi:hypothetical protein
MMTNVMRLVRVCAAVAGLCSSATIAAAEQEYRGTPAQQRACRPDVFRLCAAEIPNVRAITRCLGTKIARLSPDCRAVFENRLQ